MDAEDVLQTVFTRLLRREEQPDLSDSAGSYLHRAAVNAALDLMRARKRARTVDLDERRRPARRPRRSRTGAPPGAAASSPAGCGRRMTRLSPRQAEIFTLRYLEGLGNLEIAKMLGASQTSIAVILHRARHRLQKELGSLEGELS